jgi:hypothetical protein
MDGQIKCKKAIFRIEDHVLYCEFISKKCSKEFKENHLEKYLKAIATMSNGRYYPLLIDLRDFNVAFIFSVVRVLAKNQELKSIILSKSFVVNSSFLQFVFILFMRINDPVIPNKIFTNYHKAIRYSLETNQVYNASY